MRGMLLIAGIWPQPGVEQISLLDRFDDRGVRALKIQSCNIQSCNPISKQPTFGLSRKFSVKRPQVHGNTVNGCFAPGLVALPKVRATPSIGSRAQFD
jgi:hypothetical protein